jgi:predicted transglutaminase-like cysteine proteinase
MVYRAFFSALLISAVAAPAGAAAPPAPNSSHSSFLNRGPDMLGTRSVLIRADRFSESLKRAREDASNSPIMQRLIAPAKVLSPIQQMAFVQTAVTKSIHWISDATEWGQHDYWASASQTLSHGAGDAKNRAIVKLHALRALGFKNSDLFLTLARDQVGGPITVLTVRNGGRYYVMDDTGGRPFAVEERRKEFQPLMSFGMYGAWAHIPPAPLIRKPEATLASATSNSTTGGHK